MNRVTKEQLRQIFEEEQALLERIRAAFPWDDRAAYVGWLVNTYEYAMKSTRILALTGGRFPLDKTAFSNRFISHAAEEKGHERLLENDLKGLGVDLRNCKPNVIGQAFHQSLYYWIYEGNPVGMFGWVLALEGFAVRNVPAMHEVCLSAHGSKASSFLKVHAAEDEDHLKSAFASIASFSEEENALVAKTLRFYSQMYGILLETVKVDALRASIAA